jgi:glucose-1-phosphate cytidylyltransferase
MKVVILCGGKGTRLREETEVRPKPMVHIGDRPILWHIMKFYAHYGFKDFVLCLGYKGEYIKEYFINYEWMTNDCTLRLNAGDECALTFGHERDDWTITFADTGPDTNTGGRVKRIEKYITEDAFLLTYGDGLCDVDLNAVLALHREKGRMATLTAVHPMSPFGIIEMRDNVAVSFKEKPRLEGLVNGGFFVFQREFFKYLDENCVLEEEPLRGACRDGQLSVFEHNGFWMCMDTYKDVERLNAMWNRGERPWTVWKKNK